LSSKTWPLERELLELETIYMRWNTSIWRIWIPWKRKGKPIHFEIQSASWRSD
jgi:hypothetical protein